MKRYMPLFERKLNIYKAWYSFSTDEFYIFDSNLLHYEVSSEKFGITNDQDALRAGYIRLYTYENNIGIMSWKKPEDKVFLSLQYHVEKHSFVPKIQEVYWEALGDGISYFFPNQSFFYAEDIDEAMKKEKM